MRMFALPSVECEFISTKSNATRGNAMTHERLDFPQHATLQQFYDALETAKGQQVIQQTEYNFVSITDAMGHATQTHNGALLHDPGVGTILFEHISKVVLTGYLDDLAPYFGWNP
jgi:hypothetical protein